jgi:tryptophan-rich sensory protein
VTETPPRHGASSLLVLVALLAACLGIGALGGWITRPAIFDWYRGLAKPDWTPPDAAFAPVWTTLYVLMAAAAWLAWRARAGALAYALFAAQLALNLVWSFLFFGLRSPLAGLVDIVPQWLLIAATIAVFWRASRLAGALMIPLILWVSYALALNAAIWMLNS